MPRFAWTSLTIATYLIAATCAVYALWRSRTTQGATAWVLALLGWPLVMVPLFFIFGRNKFYGYVKRRKDLDENARRAAVEIEAYTRLQAPNTTNTEALNAIAKRNRQAGFLPGNKIDLLIDGRETFPAMFKAIEGAKDYVIFQFYIFCDDETGRPFVDLLKKKAREGVRVYFLYDGIGTKIKRKLREELEQAGIEVCRFASTKHFSTRIQINFRNHRKIIVVDGNIAFVGGLNVSNDYVGRNPKMGPWRDTHARIEGPAALAAQDAFFRDWYWAKEKSAELNWTPLPSNEKANADVMMLHTGPADDIEAAHLSHIALIMQAKTRVWIANPYVVPPEGLSDALALASLRGLDVRILVPKKNDNRWVTYASEVYALKLLPLGVRYFRYRPGFSHQKVVLIDDQIASVGSTNLDSRSMFINFEIQAISTESTFVRKVGEMLESDFAQSYELRLERLSKRPFLRRVLARAVSLLAPIL